MLIDNPLDFNNSYYYYIIYSAGDVKLVGHSVQLILSDMLRVCVCMHNVCVCETAAGELLGGQSASQRRGTTACQWDGERDC